MLIYVEAAGCPNACRHCAAGGRPPAVMAYTDEELTGLWREWGPLTIYHEPTAHPHFPGTLAPGRTIDYAGWLVSNGYGLAHRADTAAVFEQLRSYGFDTLLLTFHGLREQHDWFTCRPGAFDDLLLATERARLAGFHTRWQFYLNRRNLGDLPTWLELDGRTAGAPPQMGIAFHRVDARLRAFEPLRPSLAEIQLLGPDPAIHDPQHLDRLARPLDQLTAQAWLESWCADPDGEEFRHPFEPPTWPPRLDFSYLSLYILRDRRVYLDPYCAPRILLGQLSEGKKALLGHIRHLPPPPFRDLRPEAVRLAAEEQDLLHPHGYSLRYRAITGMRYEGWEDRAETIL